MMLCIGIACSGIAQTGRVVLSINGIDPKRGGMVSAGIFTENLFPEAGKQVAGREVKAASAHLEVVLTDVAPGAYGAAVFQDINANGVLETNMVGLPKEPIGFSNDARIRFGPPSFEDAKFEVLPGRETRVTITLHP